MDDNLFLAECVAQGIDLQRDPEIIPIIEKAREKYYETILIFPNIDKESFLSAFLAGYLFGIGKGIDMFKELDSAFKK